MFRRSIFILSCFALWSLSANASWTQIPYRDTVTLINGPRILDHSFKKRRFDFTFDARQTLISAQSAKLGGFRIGLEYRRVHRAGFGVFGLSEGAFVNQIQTIHPDITAAYLNLTYMSIYYERVLYFNPKWEWSATAHLGNGWIEGRYQLGDNTDWIAIPAIQVKPLELSSSIYYHLNWWISIGVGGGYRHMRQTPTEAREIYNAPIALFKLKVRFFKLIKGAVNPDVRNQY